ncbi:MAG: alpha-E domain-containing protein [Acidimicrobiales bacterium]|nr:alpha-E domain-containing protein [Acidimicrobiales bacterium]
MSHDPTRPPTPQEAPTMLLSRVAENAYWVGRYLERAEATARLVKTHTELFLDLPKSAGLTWAPLLAVTGSDADYHLVHDHPSEEEVVSFLLADPLNPGSVVRSVEQAREDLRVTRTMVPRRTWETLNELHLWVRDTRREGIGRTGRLAWCEEVIRRCHLVAGSIYATMNRDDTYSFLEIGRFVERADMTTRVLEVEADILMAVPDGGLRPFVDVTWLAALRSLGAEQMYRRATGGVVHGADAVRFLLFEPQFPRSVEHCLIGVSRWLLELPRQEVPMTECAALERRLGAIDPTSGGADELLRVVDDLQRGLNLLHDALGATYFSPAPSLTGAG